MGPFHQPPPHDGERPQASWVPVQSVAPPTPPPMTTMTTTRTDGKAIASLLFGIASLIPFAGVVFGIPAIILGALARRDIDTSTGLASARIGPVKLQGRALAASGIVSGLFGTGFSFVILLWLMGAMFAPPSPDDPNVNASAQSAAASSASSSSSSPAALGPLGPPTIASADPNQEKGPPPVAAGTRTYGSLEVVDLDSSKPLRAQLREVASASRSGRTIMLQTYARGSTACAAIDAALPDLRMQRALANVTLVRVDLEEYGMELNTMKVETRSTPWFYKLDAKTAEPIDSLSADAWEANLPENMAPVLGKFAQKTTAAKRRK